MRAALARRRSGTTPTSFLSLTSGARPSPGTPSEAFALGWTMVPFNTSGTLTSALSALAANQYIYYSGPGSLAGLNPAGGVFYNGSGSLTISASGGSPALTISGKNPGTPTVIDFGCSANIWDPSKITANFVKISYTGTSQIDALQIDSSSNLRIFGGEYSSGNSGNCAIRIWGLSHDFYLWDAYTNVSGSHGIQIVSKLTGGSNSQVHDFNLRLEVNRFSMNPAWDSHADKGSGIHGVELHGGGTTNNYTIAVYAHDPLRPGETSAGQTWPEGGGCSAIEPGMDIPGVNNNATIYVKAANLLFIPNGTNPGSTGGGQTGGNVVAAWGNAPLDNFVFGWLEGSNCTGTMFHCASSGTWHPGTPAIQVLHGRSSNMNQSTLNGNSSPNNVPYPSGFGINYGTDCL